MIAVHSVSKDIFLYLVFGLPVLGVVSGFYQKLRWLLIAAVLLLVAIVVSLGTLVYLLDGDRYQNSTGMEGIALFVMPVMYFASLAISMLAYWLTTSMARQHRNP